MALGPLRPLTMAAFLGGATHALVNRGLVLQSMPLVQAGGIVPIYSLSFPAALHEWYLSCTYDFVTLRVKVLGCIHSRLSQQRCGTRSDICACNEES